MPKNPEKREWSQLSDREKREVEQKLEQEQKKPKVIGLERLEAKKQIAEGKVWKEQETVEKEAAEKELAKAYPEPADKENELGRLVKETEDELTKKIEREKKASGKELSGIEIYHLIRDFYREKLGYGIEHKGFLGGRIRLKDKEGKYLLGEKTRKPIEFKKVSQFGTETPLINFLKEKYKNNIREDLGKKVSEKGKEGYKKWKEHFGPLAEAWEEQEEFEREIGKESDKLMQEKKDELVKKIEQERKRTGRKLSNTEIYTLNRNFYLGELGYGIRYRGLLGGKARIWNKEKGGYVIGEKTGKPVEFKAAFSPKGETSFLKFLEEEYKNKIIKKGLEKRHQEKAKEALATEEILGEGGEPPVIQKETRIEPPEKKEEEKTEKTEVNMQKEEPELTESKEEGISSSTKQKLIEFFEKFKIEPDENKRTGIDRQIQKTLDGLKAGKLDLAGKEIARMLVNSKRNLETAKKKKNLKLVEQYEGNIKKLEGFLEEIKSPTEIQETEMSAEELSKIIEDAIENTQKNKKTRETGEK